MAASMVLCTGGAKVSNNFRIIAKLRPCLVAKIICSKFNFNIVAKVILRPSVAASKASYGPIKVVVCITSL